MSIISGRKENPALEKIVMENQKVRWEIYKAVSVGEESSFPAFKVNYKVLNR